MESDEEATKGRDADADADADDAVSEVDSEDVRIDELLRKVKVPKAKGRHGDVHDALEGENEEQLLQRTLKNWGRNKHAYYSTNYIDPDFETDSEEERMVRKDRHTDADVALFSRRWRTPGKQHSRGPLPGQREG